MPQSFELNFRHSDSGGDIDLDRAQGQAELLRGLPHLIFLLHGYNNDKHDACVAYDAFSTRARAAVGAGRDWAPGAAVVRVFWPGDARWWIAAPLFYPWAVPRALTTGQALARMIGDLAQLSPGTLTVDCVAHSLGNRVLLHLIAGLGTSPNIWIRRVVHMAGAVPTWTLESDSRIEFLRAPLERECAADSRAVSLFSGSDPVLSLAFPIGETAASTYDGEMPVALGHCSWGEGTELPNLTQLEAVGAKHSSYWGAEKGRSASLDNWLRDTINANLDLGNSAARATPTAFLAARDTAEDRDLNTRVLAVRPQTERQPGL